MALKRKVQLLAKSMGSKTLVPVSDTIIADVTKASTKQDSTNSKFIEEALKHAVQMNALGITSKELENICEVMHDFRVLGASFLPMDITKYLMAKEYTKTRKALKPNGMRAVFGMVHFSKKNSPTQLRALEIFF